VALEQARDAALLDTSALKVDALIALLRERGLLR
jgi:hypothetical protein